MKKNLFLGLVMAAAGLIVYTSCSKDNESPAINTEAATVAASDDATSGNLYDDVQNEADENVTALESADYNASGLKAAYESGSRTITVNKPDSTKFPKDVTITYVNWTDNAGRLKNGQILIHLTGKYREQGTLKTITFSNFSIDSAKIEGTKTITNLGRNSENHLTYEAKLVDGKITLADGKTITREFLHTRTWTAGDATPRYVKDDAYTITGWAKGVNRNGVAYERNITSPIYIMAACPWVVSGTVEVKAGDKVMTLEYGDSSQTCDNVATLTVNGQTKTITLPRGRRRI